MNQTHLCHVWVSHWEMASYACADYTLHDSVFARYSACIACDVICRGNSRLHGQLRLLTNLIYLPLLV